MKIALFIVSFLPIGVSMIVFHVAAEWLLWIARRVMAAAEVYDEVLQRYEYWCFDAQKDPIFKRTLREIYDRELNRYDEE